MRNNCDFLWFHMHANKLDLHTHTHLYKIPIHSHNIPLHSHMILHTTTITHTYLQKIPPHVQHAPLHTHKIIFSKILMYQHVTRTRKYYTYKKLSQSPYLPQLRCIPLRKFCNINTSHNGTRCPCTYLE